jgi:X-Pro dipeptidyl-peptidase
VSRGWLDVRNRHSPAVTEPVRPGQEYTFSWELQPQDHIFAAGHRIGLVLISTDRDYTLRYPAGTVVTTRLGLSNVSLPLFRM